MKVNSGKWWDKAWSLVDGCTPYSPGCDHCWSAGMWHRFHKTTEEGHEKEWLTDCIINASGDLSNWKKVPKRIEFNGLIETHPERLSIPLKRRKPTVFAVWNDLFHEAVPREFIDKAFAVMALSPEHTFLVLTKRPARMSDWSQDDVNDVINVTMQYPEFLPKNGRSYPRSCYWPLSNVYLGLTVCNQQEANEKIPVFLQVPGNKFLSIEPMLGPIDLTRLNDTPLYCYDSLSGRQYAKHTKNRSIVGMTDHIDAVILGGETGPGARPMHPDWVRSVRDQCAAAGVDFFFKQWGKHTPALKERLGSHYDNLIRTQPGRFEITNAGRLLDGRTHDDLPWRKGNQL
jgi:protein gp37